MLVVALSVAANQISQASRFSNLSTCDPANDDSAPELALWSHHPAVINALPQHLPKPATTPAKTGESRIRRGFPGSCLSSSAVHKQTHGGCVRWGSQQTQTFDRDGLIADFDRGIGLSSISRIASAVDHPIESSLARVRVAAKPMTEERRKFRSATHAT